MFLEFFILVMGKALSSPICRPVSQKDFLHNQDTSNTELIAAACDSQSRQ